MEIRPRRHNGFVAWSVAHLKRKRPEILPNNMHDSSQGNNTRRVNNSLKRNAHQSHKSQCHNHSLLLLYHFPPSSHYHHSIFNSEIWTWARQVVIKENTCRRKVCESVFTHNLIYYPDLNVLCWCACIYLCSCVDEQKNAKYLTGNSQKITAARKPRPDLCQGKVCFFCKEFFDFVTPPPTCTIGCELIGVTLPLPEELRKLILCGRTHAASVKKCRNIVHDFKEGGCPLCCKCKECKKRVHAICDPDQTYQWPPQQTSSMNSNDTSLIHAANDSDTEEVRG